MDEKLIELLALKAEIEAVSQKQRLRYQENKEKRKAQAIAWRKMNPEESKRSRRNSKLKIDFGITLEQYSTMLSDQGGVCKICRKPDTSGRNLAVDHNHTTGCIRGLLCISCNTAIGLVKENENVLKAMISYLQDYKTQNLLKATVANGQ